MTSSDDNFWSYDRNRFRSVETTALSFESARRLGRSDVDSVEEAGRHDIPAVQSRRVCSPQRRRDSRREVLCRVAVGATCSAISDVIVPLPVGPADNQSV